MRRTDLPEWKDADRISDRIVELINREAERGTSPLQIFAGEMLALAALLRTAEGLSKPAPMIAVEAAIHACLASMVHSRTKPQ